METQDKQQQLESVLLQHWKQLESFIRKGVGDQQVASDVLQESLLKALQKVETLKDEDKLLPWLYQVVRNTIQDVHRSKQTENKMLRQWADESSTVSEPKSLAILCACLHDLLPAMKKEYADLIQELELQEGDAKLVAQRMGISFNNLKVRRHRAREQLRERLEQTCRLCAKHGCLDCRCGHK